MLPALTVQRTFQKEELCALAKDTHLYTQLLYFFICISVHPLWWYNRGSRHPDPPPLNTCAHAHYRGLYPERSERTTLLWSDYEKRTLYVNQYNWITPTLTGRSPKGTALGQNIDLPRTRIESDKKLPFSSMYINRRCSRYTALSRRIIPIIKEGATMGDYSPVAIRPWR